MNRVFLVVLLAWAACGPARAPGVDAGLLDAGVPDAAAGLGDAGSGSQRDGGSVDAGVGRDAGTLLPGCDAGFEPVTFTSLMRSTEAWPLRWPSCDTSQPKCFEVFSKRFRAQADLDQFFDDEFQLNPPAVDFSDGEAIVVSTCGCPTRGIELRISEVSSSECGYAVVARVDAAIGEGCFVDQTFARTFELVRVGARDAGVDLLTASETRVRGCGP